MVGERFGVRFGEIVDPEKRMDDLRQVGYSPEVARAIVQNENQFSEEH